ncbi:MAG: methyltransferase domain-containing protein [Myxococcota bacterium]
MASTVTPPSARFWDRIAERYAKKPVPDEEVYQRKLEITRGYFRPDMRVFEFGCGTGSTAIAHAQHVRQIRAVDISSKMIAIARRKAEQADVDNVIFECAEIDQLDIAPETYDVVMGHSILHLLRDKERVLEKVHAMLKPGGVFVSSTACIGDHMRWFAFVAPIGHFFRAIPYVQVFTQAELVQCVVSAGFEIEQEWRPGKDRGVFIVARKVEVTG